MLVAGPWSRAAAAFALSVALGAPAIAATSAKGKRATLTFYWVIDETSTRYRGRRDVPLRDARGKVLAHTSQKFRRALVMEGTGWLRDGRTVLYDRKIRGEHRFRVITARYGLGVTGCRLVPYRSVAVDPRWIRLGSTIYIRQLKGAHLPDGTIHDGMFVATDRGHFRGARVDIFVGAGSRSAAPFVRKGYGSRSRVSVEVVSSSGAECDR